MRAGKGRLSPHPMEAIDRTRTLTLLFEGQRIEAHPGDTVASALYAAGVRIFSRSFKYHRPRGLFCLTGDCPNCLMEVDGEPNVRVCVEPVRDGMVVRGQNAFPSLRWDALAFLDKLAFLLPPGFYYKRFIRPRFLWPFYERVIRSVAGLGRVDMRKVPPEEEDKQYLHTEVAVIGGGPAGLSAALEASRLGATVTLVDPQEALGGHLRAQKQILETPIEGAGYELAGCLAEALRSQGKVVLLAGARAFGFYEGNLIGLVQGRRLIHLRAQKTVVATGAYEQPLLFHRNDLPGIFLGRGLQRLVNLQGVRPGSRAVVVTTNDKGWEVASDLVDAGVEVIAVLDHRPEFPDHLMEFQKVKRAGASPLRSYTVQSAWGWRAVRGVTMVHLDDRGRAVPGSEREVPCDLVALSVGLSPAHELLYQSGCLMGYDAARQAFVPLELAGDIFAAGEVLGTQALDEILLEGQVAGIEAALSLGYGDGEARLDLEARRRRLEELRARRNGSRPSVFSAPGGGKKRFVCLCEDVTEGDLRRCIGEGFDNIETLKRYSTVSMGPCQGKMCTFPSARVLGRQAGKDLSRVSTPTSRPPIQPVSLGVLAGRPYHPVQLTPMHHRHLSLGAKMMDAGTWKRPEVYATPEEECRAVHERVGLIDVSTLGKLEVKGRDAVQLLEKVYNNKYQDLKVGRIRYGVMCDDSGVIFDDGTCCRLGEDHFFLTTTTAGIEAVEQWLTWWLAGTGLCAHVTNLTSALAAVNLAGPKAREVLRKVTEIDLSQTAFPYMASARGEVEGVPALLLRIGFVGELGYEIHFPAEYGEALWDALIEAGREFGISPFGVEAQRVLRLEKRHIIVGQDTDALSNPLEADMPWMVKFEKPDFLGKRALERVREEGLRSKLIGFEMKDAHILAEEGDQVVFNGRPIGRVTSARFSWALGKSIGMAWVPIERGQPGAEIQIQVHGQRHPAKVTTEPFYDPKGERLRGLSGEPAKTQSPSSSGERREAPRASSALRAKHLSLGARMSEVGGWLLPESYRPVEEEVARVRAGAGLVDLSHLGKVEVQGRDLAGLWGRFLAGGDFIGSGEVRARGWPGPGGEEVQGLWCRRAPDALFVIVPPGRAETLARALNTLAGGSCAHATDLTSGLSTLKLLGPRSREVLSHLVPIDLSPRGLPDGRCAEVSLAGVHVLLLRRDLSSLLGIQIHFRREYGEYLWDVLLDAGRAYGLTPVGLAAWYRLRAGGPVQAALAL